MRTLLPDPPPADFEQLLQRRRRWGADRHDEVWQGVLHMSPEPSRAHLDVQQQLAVILDGPARTGELVPGVGGFNLGTEDDYRAPDGGLFRERSTATWNPTAALCLEIVSPGDESWEKIPFYAAHHIDELLIVDPAKRTVDWLALEQGDYRPVDRSRLIDLGPTQLAEAIDWP